jgi:outer membrane receptor protein involved in Fe transport
MISRSPVFFGELLLIVALVLTAGAQTPASAAPAGNAQASVTGTVIDQQSALPIKDASVILLQDDKEVASSTTDAFGNFTISNVNPGVYDVNVRAKGYSRSTSLNVLVASGTTLTLNAALIAAENSANVHSLGRVSVTAQALTSATAITQTVNILNIAQTGQIRFANQLETLPATNLSTSSSPGDDISINIRGFGSSETGVLLDDRPVGPLGVDAPDSFNFANSPITALDSVDVTYGSGAQGLYGSDTLAGAVNMHMLNPSATPQYSFTQQVGGYGLLSSALNLSGTYGKFGYVGAVGTTGEQGVFNGSNLFQSARPANVQPGSVNPPFVCANASGTDVSACNNAASTYAVSQDTKLSTELARLRYGVSGATTLSVSAYSTVQWADSTGNGDNDNLPYSTRLGQIQQGSPDCTTASGSPGYTVTTNPVAGATACYTAQQWAAVSSGPDGGGAGRNRSTSMRDYDARLNTKLGVNNISLDYYVNNYVFQKDSSLSGGIDAQGALLGSPVYADYYNTHGYLVSDDITTENNDLGFGWALLNQSQAGQQLAGVSTDPISGAPIYAFEPAFDPALFRVNNYFIRDSHQFGERWFAYINAWIKASNVTGKTTFDPRISGQYRPDSSDVLRLTFGHSDGAPAPQLKSTGVLFQPDPGASLTNVSCGLNTLPTSGGNPNLISESANDWEIGYGHNFQGGSNVQLNAYVTSVSNQLFGATQPLLSYGLSNVTFASNALNTYLSRLISQGCLPPGSTATATYPFLGVSTTYNAASELARGIELNGRARFSPTVYVDYGYSIASSQQFNIPDSILQNNFTLLNGAQQLGIPLHQANLSLDVQPGAFEVRLDNYYVDANNHFDRPAYIYTNAFVSHPLDHGHLLLTLGGTNIFNQAVETYGYIGAGLPAATNSFAPVAAFTGLGQNLAGINTNELFGLQPAQFTFTVTARM